MLVFSVAVVSYTMMKHVYLCTLLLLTVSQVTSVTFGNSTAGECYSKVPFAEARLLTGLRLISAFSLSITAPPPQPTLSIDQSYWNHTSASSDISKHFHGPGINASLSSYCVASQLAFYSSAYSDFIQHSPVPPPVTRTFTLESPSEVTTETFPFRFYTTFSYAPPCCGYCTVWAANAKVFYWPTPNPHPGITTVIDSTGFT